MRGNSHKPSTPSCSCARAFASILDLVLQDSKCPREGLKLASSHLSTLIKLVGFAFAGAGQFLQELFVILHGRLSLHKVTSVVCNLLTTLLNLTNSGTCLLFVGVKLACQAFLDVVASC